MKTAIIQFPGLNRDQDMSVALTKITGRAPYKIWQTETTIPDVDLIVIPGGFSYGDYLRCGAIAARQPVMRAVRTKADQGVMIIGVCNGFQILLEAGMLEGALLRNHLLKFVCRLVALEVNSTQNVFSLHYHKGQIIHYPVAHHDGNYFADPETLIRLEDNGQIFLRYVQNDNPNGSLHNIAAITNKQGNILGMMPHPENFIEAAHGGTDGLALFASALGFSSLEMSA